jgi:hypothetical protein
MATLIQPVLSNFAVSPRAFGSSPFDLTDPTSTNTSTFSIFTFTTDSSGAQIISISGRTVTILKAGNAFITATQSASSGFSSGSITTLFTVNVATPTLSKFVISQKLFTDISFTLSDPISNSPGSVLFRSLTTDIVVVSGRVVTIKRVGRARIEAIKNPATNYGTASIVAEFDVLTSIVRVGIQNQIDLSWNRPINNGASIKNYFFYVEERSSNVTPAPNLTTILETVPLTVSSYYSYALPIPYYSSVLSSNGVPDGIDINLSNTFFNLTTSLTTTQKNYMDLGYYGEIEISWVYHNDRPILELNPTTIASTVMSISLYKEASGTVGDNRINLIRSTERTYDSAINCLGPRPQNNNKLMTDIFTLSFDTGFDSGNGIPTIDRSLKYLKPTDVISGTVKLSSLIYSSNTSSIDASYSIIIKGIRIAPYRLPITRDFTSIGFGNGNADSGVGFTVSTVNAMAPISPSGILYHMPKMTRSFTDFNEAKWSFSWNYAANITKLTTDISFLPLQIHSGSTIANITNLDIPFILRIRGYSRPYSSVSSSITSEQYNTTNVTSFLANANNTLYHTRLLFDVSLNRSASYSEIVSGTTIITTFDISGASGFPVFSELVNTLDITHTQFVFLFQLTITDASYSTYFQSISNANHAFRVKMLSQTFTPRQEYRFNGPDPTLASSNSLTSLTNTIYNITDPYNDINPYYRFYNLTNGVFYSYKISSNNRAGTSAFSELLTRRCGSIPNQIVNRIVNNQNTLTVESERTSNQVNIYWLKPGFSGYEITSFVIQMAIDPSGRWLNILEYTKDLSANEIVFGAFEDVIIPVTNHTVEAYNHNINTYVDKSTGESFPLVNGSKYYFRLASVNDLGYSLYSTILSGIVFARPATSPVTFIGTPLVGNNLVYITWKIPQDDAGSPIITYIIDYQEEITTTVNNVTTITYTSERQYKQNSMIPSANDLKNMFFILYTNYKNYDSLTASEKTKLDISRNELLKYVIPPTPITINYSDFILWTSDNPVRYVKLSFTNRNFTFISDELNQNVFDIANIQLKWYYFRENLWPDDETTVSFKMSIRGHLKDVSGNTSLDINNIFYIPPGNVYGGVESYTVKRTMFSTESDIKYIDYMTGLVTTTNSISKILIPTLPRIDSYNNRRYKLQIEYEITEFFPNNGDYRFFLYSGPVVINGSAPVRTNPSLKLNTIFTYKLENIPDLSPLLNNKTYRFRITPFNLNEFFPDVNRITCAIGTEFSVPITDMSYSLVPTKSGGIVVLQWRYTQTSDYNINITIPDNFQDGNEEYKSVQLDVGSRSIFAKTLVPNSSGIVTYSIPSTEPNDILDGVAQKYLRSGRGYNINVGAIKIVIDSTGNQFPLASPIRDINPLGTYIVPFSTPLRPQSLSVFGHNGYVSLRWKLPDILLDPNYYITTLFDSDPPLPFYRYRYFTLDVRDISSNLSAPWVSVDSQIEISPNAVAGSETVYTVTNLTNENNHQFRIRLMIINTYRNQYAFSDYTFLSNINSVPITESSDNVIYPSVYPYKPSPPLLKYINRTETTTPGLFNGLTVSFNYPVYNGNADFYECYIEYTPPFDVSGSGTVWNNVFDSNQNIGIANISSNTSILSNGRLYTSLLNGIISRNTQTFTIICKSTVLKYGIRIRVIGRKTGLSEPYPYLLYSDYTAVDYVDI